jgi:hypothetical protein
MRHFMGHHSAHQPRLNCVRQAYPSKNGDEKCRPVVWNRSTNALTSLFPVQVLGQHLGVGNNLWLQQFAHLCGELFTLFVA